MRHLDRTNLRYPQLWKGCRLSLAPCVGPSGLTIRDFSNGKRNATLTGVTAANAWSPNGTSYAFSNGSGRAVYSDLAVTVPYTFSIWARATSFSGAVGVCIGGVGYVPFNTPYALYLDGTNAYTAGTVGLRAVAFSPAVGTWYNYTYVITSSASTLYVNGSLVGSTMSAGNQTFQNIGAQADGTYAWAGQLNDFQVWDRALNTKEIRLKGLRLGIAYELTPRRKASSGIAFNRRRRLLVGAGT